MTRRNLLAALGLPVAATAKVEEIQPGADLLIIVKFQGRLRIEYDEQARRLEDRLSKRLGRKVAILYGDDRTEITAHQLKP